MQMIEAVNILRHRLNDTESYVFTDNELVRYLNLSIKGVGNTLAMQGSPWAIKTIYVPPQGVDVPEDWHSFPPGEPVTMDGGKFYPMEPYSSLNARYYFVPGNAAIDGDIPFMEPHAHNVVNMAYELAAMRLGYDVAQEGSLHFKMSGIPPVTGGGEG